MDRHQLEHLENISEADLSAVVDAFKRHQKQKTVLLLDGPMGAGKTTFTRKLLESYGYKGVQSPTFALHNRYSIQGYDIEHLDLFRMKSPAELDGVGFWDFFFGDKGLIIIEWSERMDLATMDTTWEIIQIQITLKSESQRDFEISKLTLV